MKLKNKIAIASLVALITVMGTGYYVAELEYAQVQKQYNEKLIDSNQRFWGLESHNLLLKMEDNVKGVTRSRPLKKAIKKNDIEAIKTEAVPAYNMGNMKGAYDTLELYSKSGQALFSSNNQSISQATQKLAKKAIETGKNAYDLVKNSNGKVAIKLAFPITNRGKRIAAGIYGLNLTTAVKNLHQSEGFNLVLFDGDNSSSEFSKLSLGAQSSELELPSNEPSHEVLSQDEGYLSTTIIPIRDANNQLLANLIALEDATELRQAQLSTKIGGSLILALICILSVGLIYWYLHRSLQPINTLTNSLNAVAKGDLSLDLNKNNSHDEIAQIQNAIVETVAGLRDLVGRISVLSTQVNSAADGVQAVNQDNHAGMSKQQEYFHGLNKSSQVVESAINNIAVFSSDMAAGARDTNREVENGGEIINNSMASIEKISKQIDSASQVINRLSQETETIGGVLEVIKGIAEQTNLLALNAAIEAARAGEQGRGFAVVADEVRTLASKTQDSTMEIESMIESLCHGSNQAVNAMQSSSLEVEKCVELSNQTTASFGVISPMVNDILNKNIEINDAISEQKDSVGQINQSISEVMDISAANVDNLNSATQASKDLKASAKELEQMLAQFKL